MTKGEALKLRGQDPKNPADAKKDELMVSYARLSGTVEGLMNRDDARSMLPADVYAALDSELRCHSLSYADRPPIDEVDQVDDE